MKIGLWTLKTQGRKTKIVDTAETNIEMRNHIDIMEQRNRINTAVNFQKKADRMLTS